MLKIACCAIAFLAVFSSVFAQTCLETKCADCTAENGCGWCAATQRCLAGDKNGPSGAEPCFVSWEFGSCPTCTGFGDCRSCQVHGADCYWCGTANNGTGSCKSYNSQLGCPVTHTCPCNDWETCSECGNDDNCQWCDSPNGGVCSTQGQNCANNGIPTHTCTCGSYLSCDTCKDAFGCSWCDTTSKCYNKGDANGCDLHQVGNTTCTQYCQNAGPSCTLCNALQGCVWCSDTQSCADTDVATCKRQPACEKCEGHRYCDPCLDETGCHWCEGPQPVCSSKGCPSGIPEAHDCLSYCNGLTAGGCKSCRSHEGCNWCEDSKVCVDADKPTSCFLAHTCTDTPSNNGKCGFDGGAFVGGMFLVIGLAILGGGAFAFYRYKSGKSLSYNELK